MKTAEWPVLRIVDGGNCFNAYTVARAARGRPEVLGRITVSRAFTCYQVLSLLESMPAIPVPVVILDLLNTFYDESVQAGERKRLLRACLGQLERLERVAGGLIPVTALLAAWRDGETDENIPMPPLLVSVYPPKVASHTAVELLEMLQAGRPETYFLPQAPAAPETLRMF